MEKVYEVAYTNNSLSNECEKGKVDTDRVWWVQAEAVVVLQMNISKQEMKNINRLHIQSGDLLKNIW